MGSRMRKTLVVLIALLGLWVSPASAQVAFDSCAESHTGTTGSASEGSFTIASYTPVGTPRGAFVFTFTLRATTAQDDTLSVDYGATAMTAVSGGATSVDSGAEAMYTKTYFLGSSVPTGAQTITITRTNNTDIMYAVVCAVTAGGDTETYNAGIVLVTSASGSPAEQSVSDGSPAVNSLRFAAGGFGHGTIPAAGAASTAGPSIDLGATTMGLVYETTAGTGSRNVGFTEAAPDEIASVHIAVRQVAAAASGPPLGGLGLMEVGR